MNLPASATHDPVSTITTPSSAHGLVAGGLCAQSGQPHLHICANDRELEECATLAHSAYPALTILTLPAWDCLPYDRVSPSSTIIAQRIATLSRLAAPAHKNLLLLTTISAAMQKLLPRDALSGAVFSIDKTHQLNRDALTGFMVSHGYSRVSKVMEPGEFALRGNIIDLFAPGFESAVRIDTFGDEIETLKFFDPLTQISTGACESLILRPTSELLFNEERIERFRSRYRDLFGAVTKDDPLYEAISAGRHSAGAEHWLPLFYESLDTVFDYLPGASVSISDQIEPIYTDRLELLQDYYQARLDAPADRDAAPYHPVAPESHYLLESDWHEALFAQPVTLLSPFDSTASKAAIRSVPSFTGAADDRLKPLKDRVQIADKSVLIACYSQGSADRVQTLLHDAQLGTQSLSSLAEWKKARPGTVGVLQLAIEHGFETADYLLLSEQDVLGERVIRTQKRKRMAEAFMAEAAAFDVGELMVHKEHGIGRFDGLMTLDVDGVRHDCLKLVYAEDAKLFLPVVNMEMVARFGSDAEGVPLDKLGGLAWQKRKAAMKKRIQIAAAELLKIAAKRMTREAPELVADNHSYNEFCARFAFSETEDQQAAIDTVLEDLASGKPMDRLICGDVGFGKTEVALRAAFVAARSGMQVAVVAPTTLLCRQHYLNFKERFEGFGLKVRQLSRLVSAKDQTIAKEELADGKLNIVIGTHALLAKGIAFHNLGLMVVDEEQRFGVAQKERLKQLRANVHVLTLSATPIPRTLQMALSGVRDLSLITTPPVDRLAIRSFVMPYDGVTVKEAILREYHRGGKVFYVTPRIEYIADIQERLATLVPDLKVCVAHGQMPPGKLDTVMQEFYDGKYDILLSTAIIESGLDVPTANTMIIDHSELFGLSQLYQLRGRVGRGKTRAYAYLTLPGRKKLSDTALKRLEVMRTLDTLGAGFALASHDMDIRGFGNLIGEEQSGHVREVGVELYQHMLEEAIAALKSGHADEAEKPASDWSPQINLGTSVLIPESYVEALDLRMNLYRRLSTLETQDEIAAFGAELIDRFGPQPPEVKQLLHVLHIKHLCKISQIERIDTGPKGAVFTFRNNAFPRPEALLRHITQAPQHYKIRQDQKLVYLDRWRTHQERFEKVSRAVETIAGLAA